MKSKLILFPLFCFIIAFSGKVQAQEEMTLTGQVFYGKRTFINFDTPEQTDTLALKKFKVYLLKSLKQDAVQKKIFKAKESNNFKFTIRQKQLKRYKYLEFYSRHLSSNYIIKLDTLSQRNFSVMVDDIPVLIAKPIIYLYPEKEQTVQLTLDFKGKLLNTYPKYDKGWTVKASPDGKLIDTKDGREHEYLFWDGTYTFSKEHYDYKSGFYVRRADYIPFLQSKLSHIGLTDREANDFIAYWLPELNKNEISFIHFRINDNIDNTAFISCVPQFDTHLRVYMEFKKASKKNIGSLPESKLPKIQRKGSVLVEWGGAVIKND
ncbi:hypothetical protein [Flammeovirga sp. SJP92]|uniref:hypothetical protein n=1 Tax=Flammeovirga sp. SJP92 TaxID=1775430 RepID=UPI0007891E09|nr:hypothetical protein [Flammeovirga sp. SJP92]KXX71400.1 hypothetical protein AVL50_05725 [Flammeovirga sp. SJP92]